MASGTITKYVEATDSGWIYPLTNVTEVKYRAKNGVVYITFESWLYPSDWSGTGIFKLPAQYNPGTQNIILRRVSDNLCANCWIHSGGTINISSGNKGETLTGTAAFPL